jgi:DNA (cytosine-5)-methyltransferase 1
VTLTFGSLFAGIGGLDLGLERAGMMCAWQVEIDPYCQKVLAKHWPNVERFADVRECGKHNLKSVDLICGGFPCQPHSVAGKRRGAADDRNLWPEYRRIIAELKPRWVVAENVPGIITTYLDTVLSDLESEGYEVGTFNIPACAFDAPHRRERIFIVAYAHGGRLPEQGVCTEQSGRAEAISTGQDVADTEDADGGRTGAAQYAGWRNPQTGGRGVGGSWLSYWSVESDVGRVAHGVPRRVDRLRALGNAVVPQVAEWIGRRIMEAV